MRLAIYDLDRTITRKPTFTAFLMFASARIAPWRLLFAPLWVLAMIGYRIGLYSRTALKTFGMRLMLGQPSLDRLREIGRAFAERRIAGDGLMPGALRLIAEDRAAGAQLMIATAAFEFYAAAFAEALDIPALVATRWDGKSIPGGNCYGAEKKRRVLAWMAAREISPDEADIRFVSDSFADSPLLEIANEPIFVTENQAQAKKAQARGWDVQVLSV